MWTYWLKKYEICGNIVKPILKDRMAPVVVVVVAVVAMVQLMALETLLPFHFRLVYISTSELAKFWCVRTRRVCMRQTLPKHGSTLGVHFFSRRMIMWYIRLVRQGEWLWMSLSPYYPLATQVAKTRLVWFTSQHVILEKIPDWNVTFGVYIYIYKINHIFYCILGVTMSLG